MSIIRRVRGCGTESFPVLAEWQDSLECKSYVAGMSLSHTLYAVAFEDNLVKKYYYYYYYYYY